MVNSSPDDGSNIILYTIYLVIVGSLKKVKLPEHVIYNSIFKFCGIFINPVELFNIWDASSNIVKFVTALSEDGIEPGLLLCTVLNDSDLNIFNE